MQAVKTNGVGYSSLMPVCYVTFFRYVFFFMLPWLPETWLGTNNGSFVEDWMVKDKKMGVVNRGMITKGDVDVYKYYMQRWGKSSTIVIIGKSGQP